jgi:hypothetical protein
MRKITILLASFMMLSIGLLSGCTSQNNIGGIREFQGGGPHENATTQKPYYVVSYTARRGFEGINYVFYIDVVVQNTGNASGQARVWSELNQNSNHYEKHQDVYLSAGESQSFTFKYAEYSYWSTDSGGYQVWIENI